MGPSGDQQQNIDFYHVQKVFGDTKSKNTYFSMVLESFLGSQVGPSGTTWELNGTKWEQDGNQLGPSEDQMGPSGDQMGPNGTKWGPNGTKLGPRANQIGPSGDQQQKY